MLIKVQTLEEYFSDILQDLIANSTLKISDDVTVYLINLLNDFSRSENLYAGVSYGEKQVFVDMLLRAQESSDYEAIRILRHMGDSSLYVCGFFSESIDLGSSGTSYYKSVGETAYGSVATLVKETNQAELFNELALSFNGITALFNTMSMMVLTNTEHSKPLQLIDMIERYRKTQNPQVLEFLKANGIFLDKNNRSTH